jgi:flagellar motor switch protein FliM
MLATYLTTLLRTIVDVNLLSIDQVTFLEFTMAMSNPGCIWIFDLEKYEGKGIIEISPAFMLLTIERLFGGEGKHSGEVKSLSIIEQNVSGKIIEKCFQIYQEAWEKAIPIKPTIQKFEMNPQFVRIAPANEIVVVMFLEINVRDQTFPMNICFPYFVIDPIIQKISADNWLGHTQTQKSQEGVRKVEGVLKASQVEMTVVLGETRLSVDELNDIKKDDVILLDTGLNDPLKIKVGKRTRFMGTVGLSGKKMALCIENVIPVNSVEP